MESHTAASCSAMRALQVALAWQPGKGCFVFTRWSHVGRPAQHCGIDCVLSNGAEGKSEQSSSADAALSSSTVEYDN